MEISNNTILITGGATGIGFALAKSFVELGNDVIICGRRESKLKEAKEKLPKLYIRRCDISKSDERKELFGWVVSNFNGINILVNNAGIQRAIDLKKGMEELSKVDDEIEINLKSQMHMSVLFIPVLSKQSQAAIVNVSSGLGIIPLARFPVYCATKAAIHAFTISLRRQLRDTQVKVFEVIPPTVYDTELKGKPLEKTDWSISSSEMADYVISGMESDKFEITAGASARWLNLTKEDAEKVFSEMNR